MENKMEDRMKAMEDRIENKMKKFEKVMRNAATTSPCNVMIDEVPQNNSSTHL